MAMKKRILLAKLGLDGHDNGIRIVSMWLRDSGYEVIYLGLYNSAERVVNVAIEEDVDAIGVSFLGGEHFYYTRSLIGLMKEKGISAIKLFVGGVIPKVDVKELENLGVNKVFTSFDRRDKVISTITHMLSRNS
jgi:methylmalonyl-CoA mutase C-terminal domain/subunit